LPPEVVKKCLSRMSGKLSRTVLRRGKGSNPFFLVDYTSRQYNRLIQKYDIKASMSRKGNCWDNVCMENFFSHFKSECFHLYSFRTAEEVTRAVHRYIYFYNHQRFQKKLNNLAPYEYRTQIA